MRLEVFFIVIGVLLAVSIIIQKMFLKKLQRTYFVAIICLFFGLYILSSLSLFIFEQNIYMKLFMVLCMLSPFIIGKLATYEKENLFTAIQILTPLLSSFIIFMMGIK